jgi:hypothetical protein
MEPEGGLPVKIIVAGAGENDFQSFAGKASHTAQAGGEGAKVLDNLGRGIDVGLDFVELTPAKRLVFVYRTKGALVPRAVSGETEKQAARFAGRANRPLFEC